MRINHNIAALNTYRQLGSANNAQQSSMEKLSSGLRINGAKDDAAGLAISEKMRAQVRGLDQASANAQDGISMLQTAEGALSETHDILQRMRELATQAANDTNTDTDRGEIQKEINQLTSEINRIGNTTEFNTQKLLNGGVEKTAVAVTGTVGELGADKTADVLGTVEAGISFEAATPATATLEFTDTATLDDTVTVNGVEFTFKAAADASQNHVAMGASPNDTAQNLKAAIAAIQADEEHADYAALSGIAVSGDAAELTFTVASGDISTTLAATGFDTTLSVTPFQDGETATKATFTVEVTDDLAVGDTVTVGGQTYTAIANGETPEDGSRQFALGTDPETTAASLASKIAGDAENTFTAAAVSTETITLTQRVAADPAGEVPEVSVNSTGTPGQFSFTATVPKDGETYYVGGQELTLDIAEDADADAVALALKTAIEGNEELNAKFSVGIDEENASKITLIEKEASTDAAPTVEIAETGAGAANGFAATFQVGANAGQSMTIEVRDMRATSDALKIASEDGAASASKSGKTPVYTEATDVTNGTNNVGSFKALDVTSHDNASAAIDVINDAIEEVSAERSKLGAYQNRLDHTINNLSTSSENLTAAESRIRDVDYALAA